MEHLKLSRRIMTVALLLVGLLFWSQVHAISRAFIPETRHVVVKMSPVFSYDDEDDDGDSYDDADDGDDDGGDD